MALQFLVPKGLVEKSFRSLAFFNTPEDKFRQIYIDHHAESTQILKFHEEKLDLSSVSILHPYALCSAPLLGFQSCFSAMVSNILFTTATSTSHVSISNV
uniref:Uncharacterized protein n=1 Tax=Salix viminalis TaxID=40686 RepID=A0A6N2KXX5_SALVM